MARKSFSVLFFIKKGKLLKNGEAPVCMRITVNGCMVDISIKRSCPVNLWNQAKENSKGKDRMSVELNHINRKTFCDAFPNHFVSILHLLTQNELRFFIHFPTLLKGFSKSI